MDNEGTLPPNDTSPSFLEHLNAVSLSTGVPVWFRAPFLEQRMNKDMIARMGREVGAPLDLTSSCVEGWMAGCGVCPQCLQRPSVMAAWRS